MKTSILPILLLLFSCNSLSGHIEQQVDNKIEASKQEMSADVQKTRQDFLALYQTAVKNEADSLNRLKLQELHNSITSTDNYLDSLKKEMNQLTETDIRNIELVKTTFLYKRAGDSIVHKMKTFFVSAQSVAKTAQSKAAIKASEDSLFSEPDAGQWKEQTFGLTNSVGASMILYGLQTELYKTGTEALKGF